MKPLALCTLISPMFFAPVAAFASDLPPACDATNGTGTRATQRSYRTGVTLGNMLVTQAWARSGECYFVEEFVDRVDAVLDRFVPAADPSETAICRYTGVYEGAVAALDALTVECGLDCQRIGEIAGEFAARVYCDISIALNGLVSGAPFVRPDVQLCGLAFEIGCDSAFVDLSRSYSNSENVSCTPYTEGQYLDVWLETRQNQCVFELPPEPEFEPPASM